MWQFMHSQDGECQYESHTAAEEDLEVLKQVVERKKRSSGESKKLVPTEAPVEELGGRWSTRHGHRALQFAGSLAAGSCSSSAFVSVIFCAKDQLIRHYLRQFQGDLFQSFFSFCFSQALIYHSGIYILGIHVISSMKCKPITDQKKSPQKEISEKVLTS